MTFEDVLDKVQKEIKKSQQELDSYQVVSLPDDKQWEMFSEYVMDIKDKYIRFIDFKYNAIKYSQLFLSAVLFFYFIAVDSGTGMLVTGLLSIFLTIVLIPSLHEKKVYKKKYEIESISRKYKELHMLFYKDGEYYRAWYINFVLKESVFDYQNIHQLEAELKYPYSLDDEYLSNLKSHIFNMKQANTDKNHWINSLPTSRFLSFKEVEQVNSLKKSLSELKRNDATIKAFEEYMKQKEEKRKERYLVTYLEEIKLTLEQNGFEVTQEENSLFVNGKEIYLEQTVINLDGEPVVDIQSLIEILSN